MAAQAGLARQNQELDKRLALQARKEKWQANWLKAAKLRVERLAAEEKARWYEINPAYAANPPARGCCAKVTLLTKTGVAGEDFQAPSAPGPVVTAIDGPYDALKPGSGSAIDTFFGSLVECRKPALGSAALIAPSLSPKVAVTAPTTTTPAVKMPGINPALATQAPALVPASAAPVAPAAQTSAPKAQMAEQKSGMPLGVIGLGIAAGAFLLLRKKR